MKQRKPGQDRRDMAHRTSGGSCDGYELRMTRLEDYVNNRFVALE